MIRLSELQLKEVILIKTGSRLGYISDLEIDPTFGRVTALIISTRQKGGIFGRMEEMIIDWNQIVTIGSDVILVNSYDTVPLHTEEHRY